MPRKPKKLVPWLISSLNDKTYSNLGMEWKDEDEEEMLFWLPWPRQKSKVWAERHSQIFLDYVRMQGRYKEGDDRPYVQWKASFRTALHKDPCITEIKDSRQKHRRLYKITNYTGTSSTSSSPSRRYSESSSCSSLSSSPSPPTSPGCSPLPNLTTGGEPIDFKILVASDTVPAYILEDEEELEGGNETSGQAEEEEKMEDEKEEEAQMDVEQFQENSQAVEYLFNSTMRQQHGDEMSGFDELPETLFDINGSFNVSLNDETSSSVLEENWQKELPNGLNSEYLSQLTQLLDDPSMFTADSVASAL